MWESLNRRLEILAREIAAGPKLRPGFTATADGKLSYASPEDRGFFCRARPSDVPQEAAPSAPVFNIGDRVRAARGTGYERFALGSVGVVVRIRGRTVLVRFDPGQAGLDPTWDSYWFVADCDLERLEPMAAKPQLKVGDPMTEPLEVGDLAEVLLEGYDDHKGRIISITPGWWRVEGLNEPIHHRSSLKLLEKGKK